MRWGKNITLVYETIEALGRRLRYPPSRQQLAEALPGLEQQRLTDALQALERGGFVASASHPVLIRNRKGHQIWWEGRAVG